MVYIINDFMKSHSGGYDPLQIAGGDATSYFIQFILKAKNILKSKQLEINISKVK